MWGDGVGVQRRGGSLEVETIFLNKQPRRQVSGPPDSFSNFFTLPFIWATTIF